MDATAFSPDYVTARSRFRAAVAGAGGRLETLPLDARGPGGESLGIDVAWLGAASPRRVLLHSSGLHGVEGFAGSAIQLQLLDDAPAIPADAALVLAHVLNPYGMAWLRRVNEENVDLNRNFLAPGTDYAGAPAAYGRFDAYLNPPSPPSRDFFVLRSAWLIARYGLPVLKQTFAGGQYEYPKGLFFGGRRLQQGPERLQAWVAERLGGAGSVVAIDVHTGLGPFGEDTLLVPEEPGSPLFERLRGVFGERVAGHDPARSVSYVLSGGYPTMLARVLPKATLYFLNQEFGTHKPIRVLHALRQENRWHHHGGGGLDHPTKRALKAAFCPDDAAWRDAVLARGRALLAQAAGLAFSASP